MTEQTDLPEISRVETIRREYEDGKLIHEQTTTVVTREPAKDNLPIGMYL